MRSEPNGDGERRRPLWFDIERDLLCSADPAGRFLLLNRACEQILGWSREELMSRPFLELVHPEDVARTRQAMDRVSDGGFELAEFENRYRAKDGGWRWLRWQARADGTTWLAVAYDITDGKRAEERLRLAISDGRLVAYGQPIMEREGGRILREELVARVRVPDARGVIAAATFIPQAERHRVVGVIDHHMLRKAVERVCLGIPTNVDVSAHTLADEALAAELVDIVGEARRPVTGLVLEIPESAAIRNLEATRDLAERLAPWGCGFALGDFGTGYGSLSQLRSLPIGVLKIGREFVAEAARRPEDRALVRGVVATAEQFGILTIAEGVEDRATLDVVASIGVDMVQGPLIGRPHPLAPGLNGAPLGGRRR